MADTKRKFLKWFQWDKVKRFFWFLSGAAALGYGIYLAAWQFSVSNPTNNPLLTFLLAVLCGGTGLSWLSMAVRGRPL